MRRLPRTVCRYASAEARSHTSRRSISHAASSAGGPSAASTSASAVSGSGTRTLTTSKYSKSPAVAVAVEPSQSPPPLFGLPKAESVYNGPPSLFSASASSASPSLRDTMTILPPPLPDKVYSTENESYYPNTSLQERLLLIEYCLQDLLDVKRAGNMFDEMRRDLLYPVPETFMNVTLYNRMLDAYFQMIGKQPSQAAAWSDTAWNLYDEMASGILRTRPDASTFHIALSALSNYPSECATSEKAVSDILGDILKYRASLQQVVTRSGELESEKALQMIDLVEASSVKEEHSCLAREAQALRESLTKADPLEGVAEAIPVQKATEVEAVGDTPAKTVFEVPYNIRNLRQTLQGLVESRNEVELEERQRRIEALTYEAARERMEKEYKELENLQLTTGLKQTSIQAWMWQWYIKLKDRISEDIRTAKAKMEDNEGVPVIGTCFRPFTADFLGPFLTCLPPDKLAIIAIMEILTHQGAGGVDSGIKTTRALKEIGRAVEAEYQARLLRKHKINYSGARPGVTMSANGLQSLIDRRRQAKKAEQKIPKHLDTVLQWTEGMRLKVGAFCLDALMDTATIERRKVVAGVEHVEQQPAFSLEYEYIRGFKVGVVRLNAGVSEQMAKDRVSYLVHPRQLPMLVPPRPWTSSTKGAYLGGRSMVMRTKNSAEQGTYLAKAAKDGKLEKVFSSLDVLSSTPWVINREVFDVVLKVWNSGKSYPSVPPTTQDVPNPVKPENHDSDLRARADYLSAVREIANRKRNNHSERCSTNYKVEIARSFLGEVFYLPHNVDFRGRAYPIPPHLSQVGDDLSRGLLKFAEARPLGARGLRWLKIHLANVFGNDKANFDDREQFTTDHLDDVYDSATKPLEGRQWWLKADDPWQCLATCIELRHALESPDPLAYESNLPIHQDGTCNGLQHYAALGGDAIGAAQVNLDVTEKPSDVYTYVANMVEAEIAKDVEKGNSDAKHVAGKVSRKVVKQTVMTTVYGVTMIGARAQIERQLLDRGDIPANVCWSCAHYLARKTLGCIGDLFRGANSIQDWFNLSARAIARSVPPARVEAVMAARAAEEAKEAPAEQQSEDEAQATASAEDALEVEVEGQTRPEAQSGKKVPSKPSLTTAKRADLKQEQMTSVIWTTILGLPIVQPYRKTKRKQIYTGVQSLYIADPTKPSEVSPTKQASAFPPNFIHSLDATHMMLTALEMRKNNLTFASVHDSYWSHASSVDDMSTIIRDTFVWLHSQDILKRLQDEFHERYSGYRIPITSLSKHDIDRIVENSDLEPEKKVALLLLRSKVATYRTAKEKAMDQATLVAENEKRRERTKQLMETARKAKAEREEQSAEESDGAVDEAVKTIKGLDLFIDLKHMLPPMPEKGTFDVQRTKNSPYFFS